MPEHLHLTPMRLTLSRYALAIALAAALVTMPTVTHCQSPVQAEQAFVEQLAAKLEAAESAPTVPAVPEVPKDPAPAPAKKPDEPTDPDPAPPAPDGDGDAPASKPTDDDAADTTDDQPDDAPEPTDDDEPGAGEGAESEDELDPDFTASATKHKIPTSLEDIPEAGRPLVAKRIKEIEAGFTRAMQEARAYRSDEIKFRAEERFRTENPAMYVAEMLRTNPALGDEVNEILDGLTTTTTKEAHEIVVRDKRAKVADTLKAELATQDARAERGIQLDQYTRSAAKRAGVPVELGVEEAVVAHIAQYGDVSEADIDRIVKEKADKYQRHIRANRRAESAKYVKEKVATKATAGLKVKPGSGSAPAPAGKPKPKSTEDFIEQFAARMA